MTLDREKTARDLLAFYSEAGVDAIGESPVDRFADPAPLAEVDSSPPPERGRTQEGVQVGVRTAETQWDRHPTAARSPSPFQGEVKRAATPPARAAVAPPLGGGGKGGETPPRLARRRGDGRARSGAQRRHTRRPARHS